MSEHSRRGFFGMVAAAVVAPAVAPVKVECLGDASDPLWKVPAHFVITDRWTMNTENFVFKPDGTFQLRPNDQLKGQLIESE